MITPRPTACDLPSPAGNLYAKLKYLQAPKSAFYIDTSRLFGTLCSSKPSKRPSIDKTDPLECCAAVERCLYAEEFPMELLFSKHGTRIGRPLALLPIGWFTPFDVSFRETQFFPEYETNACGNSALSLRLILVFINFINLTECAKTREEVEVGWGGWYGWDGKAEGHLGGKLRLVET